MEASDDAPFDSPAASIQEEFSQRTFPIQSLFTPVDTSDKAVDTRMEGEEVIEIKEEVKRLLTDVIYRIVKNERKGEMISSCSIGTQSLPQQMNEKKMKRKHLWEEEMDEETMKRIEIGRDRRKKAREEREKAEMEELVKINETMRKWQKRWETCKKDRRKAKQKKRMNAFGRVDERLITHHRKMIISDDEDSSLPSYSGASMGDLDTASSNSFNARRKRKPIPRNRRISTSASSQKSENLQTHKNSDALVNGKFGTWIHLPSKNGPINLFVESSPTPVYIGVRTMRKAIDARRNEKRGRVDVMREKRQLPMGRARSQKKKRIEQIPAVSPMKEPARKMRRTTMNSMMTMERVIEMSDSEEERKTKKKENTVVKVEKVVKMEKIDDGYEMDTQPIQDSPIGGFQMVPVKVEMDTQSFHDSPIGGYQLVPVKVETPFIDETDNKEYELVAHDTSSLKPSLYNEVQDTSDPEVDNDYLKESEDNVEDNLHREHDYMKLIGEEVGEPRDLEVVV